jgi:hypothetical protein
MQVKLAAGTALCIAMPVALLGLIAVADSRKVVKLVAEWHFSQATVPTGMWFSFDGVVGEAPQADRGIGTGW